MSGATDMVLGRVIDLPDNMVVQHIMDDGSACVVRKDHPTVGDRLSHEQYEEMKYVNVLLSGRMRAGLFQALQQRGVKR